MAKLKALKQTIHALNDKWLSSVQREDRAALWNKLEKAKKEYDELEEELDTRPRMSERDRKALKLKELKAKVKDLNNKVKNEMQREEKAILSSKLERAQKEAEALEKELDESADKEKKKPRLEKPTGPETPEKHEKPTTPEGEKTPEEIAARKIFIFLLEKAKGGDMLSIEMLVIFMVNQMKVEWFTQEERGWRDKLIILYKETKKGDTIAIANIVNFINDTINIWITINPPQTPPPPTTPPQPPTPTIPTTPESGPSLDNLRDEYLKAKRLRGNAFRGLAGRLFGRKLAFGTEEMDFGGKKGAQDLEKVRQEYQLKLDQYRRGEIAALQNTLDAQLASGAITAAEYNAQMQTKIINLLEEEQSNIDNKSVSGIEKNTFEKMKTWWRQHGKARLGIGGLLFGAGVLTAGTGAAAGVVSARVVLGGVGTYVGVEAALERYGKTLGHVGMINEINKKGPFATVAAVETYIAGLPNEDVKKEAARLRMLQVEKGVALGNLDSRFNNIVLAIIKRDNEMTAQEAMSTQNLEDPTLNFANRLSNRLALEINTRNATVEKEVDRERIKKMFRKTTAALAGGAVGWLIGGELFEKPDVASAPISEAGSESITYEPHTVASGENLWKIIESDLDTHNTMVGLGEGARTHVVDALKDMFDKMSPDELRNLGFSSGDADLLYAGDSLNLSGALDNPGVILRALFDSHNLSPENIKEIVDNNAKIAKWLVEHSGELKTPYNSEIIEEVLRGIR